MPQNFGSTRQQSGLIEITELPDFQSLQWPPELEKAELHARCNVPGEESPVGEVCPCCGEKEKVNERDWIRGDVFQQFQANGGGIPTYFSMSCYLSVCLLLISAAFVFHIYVIERVCQEGSNQCTQIFGFFKFCSSDKIYNTLYDLYDESLALAYLATQNLTFVYFLACTVGLRFWLEHVKQTKLLSDDKFYNKFSLIFKNVPRTFRQEDIKRQISRKCGKQIQICQVLILQGLDELDQRLRSLIDLAFQISDLRGRLQQNSNDRKAFERLKESTSRYQVQYSHYQTLKADTSLSTNGRTIVVFNRVSDCLLVKEKFQINSLKKAWVNLSKVVQDAEGNEESQGADMFCDPVSEPWEINWRFIGESSVHKTVVQIKTTFLGFGLMLACFAMLYFPIVRVDEERNSNPTVGSVLNIVISVAIFLLAIIFRAIILALIPSRKPSCKLSESGFVIFVTTVFHFFFYLLAPGTYYLLAFSVDPNIKLKLLFENLLTYLLLQILLCLAELGFRRFQYTKSRLLDAHNSLRNRFCQGRLHEQITPPSFPLEFKVMILLNIWSISAFYVFEIPYVLFVSGITIVILYWLDKRFLYRHYLTRDFFSISLQIDALKRYNLLFLFFISGSYTVTAFFTWQYYFVWSIFLLCLTVHLISDRYYQKRIKKKQSAMVTLQELKKRYGNRQSGTSNRMSFKVAAESLEMKSALIAPLDQKIMASKTSSFSGYSELYSKYLSRFQDKQTNYILERKYEENRKWLLRNDIEIEISDSDSSRMPISKETEMHPLEQKNNITIANSKRSSQESDYQSVLDSSQIRKSL